MLFLRALVVLMLGAGVACFAIYAVTGSARYRSLGVRIVKWTVVAGLVFFGVLILEWVAPFL
ncbi:MAG TPA: hypothetical protein VF319_17335 [Caldimonas sp.]